MSIYLEKNKFFLRDKEDGELKDVGVIWSDTNESYSKSEVDTMIANASTDVQINGISVTNNGVANIPIASASQAGLVSIDGNGLGLDNNRAKIVPAENIAISARNNSYNPIVSSNLDFAVKAALTDGKGVAYSDAEKLAAQTRLGIYPMSEEGY